MKTKLLFLLFALSGTFLLAQDKVKYSKEQLREMDNELFEETFTSFSPKKTSTVVTKDGKTYVGFVKDLDRKKGQIYAIKLKDSANGKEESLDVANIAEIYLFAGGFQKAMKMDKYFSNSRNWGRKSLNKNFKNDRIPFLNEKVSLKNKDTEKEFMMQLINPTFSDLIKVYADPFAAETTTVSFGGIGVSGGVTKSYYIKKNGKVFWLQKSDFEENYSKLFGDNPEFMRQYPYNSIKWEHLSFLINQYTKMSQK